jgi:hypothetical protein
MNIASLILFTSRLNGFDLKVLSPSFICSKRSGLKRLMGAGLMLRGFFLLRNLQGGWKD